jgi:hypothetical protein
MQATVYVTDWPLTPSRNIYLYLDPDTTLPYDSLQETLAASELQVLAPSSVIHTQSPRVPHCLFCLGGGRDLARVNANMAMC